jgi:signal transduction histidine kinase
MTETIAPASLEQRIADRSRSLRASYQHAIWRQTDRLFAFLFVLQWVAGVAMALWLSPLAWEGLDSRIHPHVWAAVFLGGIIAAFPIALAIGRPGQTMTRMVIGVAQMLESGLLIHLSGGRIEMHFHIFGSLAFLSFYRDWRVLVPATIVMAADHAMRGIFWPESVFGVLAVSPWRWIEHAGWVLFEDIFLVWACVRGAEELAMLALRQAELETTNERVEAEVQRKTARLESMTQELVSTARSAGMAEAATGVLRNVGNVLNSVNTSADVARQKLKNSQVSTLLKASELFRGHEQDLADSMTSEERGKAMHGVLMELAKNLGQEQFDVLEELERMSAGLEHIKEIVFGQQTQAKSGNVRQRISPAEIVEEAVARTSDILTAGEFQIVCHVRPIPPVILDRHRVLQILIALVSNAAKAISAVDAKEKRITVWTRLIETDNQRRIQFEVGDNGIGIKSQDLATIFNHEYAVGGQGESFGLHNAYTAAREMGGSLSVKSEGLNHGANFVLDLPLSGLTAAMLLQSSLEIK